MAVSMADGIGLLSMIVEVRHYREGYAYYFVQGTAFMADSKPLLGLSAACKLC